MIKGFIQILDLIKSQLGLPEDKFIFCSFNNPYKIQPNIFATWMEILNENNNSVLWLLENEKLEARDNIYEEEKKELIKKELFLIKNLL